MSDKLSGDEPMLSQGRKLTGMEPMLSSKVSMRPFGNYAAIKMPQSLWHFVVWDALEWYLGESAVRGLWTRLHPCEEARLLAMDAINRCSLPMLDTFMHTDKLRGIWRIYAHFYEDAAQRAIRKVLEWYDEGVLR